MSKRALKKVPLDAYLPMPLTLSLNHLRMKKRLPRLLRAALNVPRDNVLETHFGPAILPDIWRVQQNSFTVQADVSSILAEHGPGVYMINLVGSVDSNSMYISKYAIFVD